MIQHDAAPDAEIDPDSIDTRPINKLAVLRADARAATALRDAVVDRSSSAWRTAHEEARAAWQRVSLELERINRPSTCHASATRELLALERATKAG